METALFLPIISILLLVVAAGLFFLALTYRRLAEHFEHLRDQTYHQNSNAHQKASKLISQAREQSLEMLESTEEKAQQILIKADFFSAASQKELGEKLAAATQKHLEEYDRMLSTFRRDLQKTFSVMSEDLQTGASKELGAFRESIQKQTNQVETDFTAQLSKNFQLTQAEVEAYKQAMLKKIDQQAFAIVKDVLQTVTPKMLTNKDHETLVIQALQDAKQRHAI